MKVTKVNGYEMKRNATKGYLVDTEGHVVDRKGKETEIENLEHLSLDYLVTQKLRRALAKQIKGFYETEDKDKVEVDDINEKRKLIKGMVRTFSYQNGELFLTELNYNRLETICTCLNDCKYPRINKKGKKISKSVILGYSLKNKTYLKEQKFEQCINGLLGLHADKKLNKNIAISIVKKYIEKDYVDSIVEIEQKNNNKTMKFVNNSIKENKIRKLEECSKIVDRKSFKFTLYKLLEQGENSFEQELERYKNLYNLEKLVKVIKVICSNTVIKEESNVFKEVSYIRENVKFNGVSLKNITPEEFSKRIKYNPYFKNRLLKKALIGFQKNHPDLLLARKKKSGLNFYDEEVSLYLRKNYPFSRVLNNEHTKSYGNYNKADITAEDIHKGVTNQIINKITLEAIKTGNIKELSHKNNSKMINMTSNDLEKMHIEDVFTRKLSSAVTYAANNYKKQIFNPKVKENFYELIQQYEEVIETLNSLAKDIFERQHLESVSDMLQGWVKEKDITIKRENSQQINVFIQEVNNLNNSTIEKHFWLGKKNKKFCWKDVCLAHQYNQTISQLMKFLKSIKTRNEDLTRIYKNFHEYIKPTDDILSVDNRTNNEQTTGKEQILEDYINILGELNRTIAGEYSHIYSFIRKAIYSFRNTSFHYKNMIDDTFLRKDGSFRSELNILEKDMSQRVNIIPQCEIEKAYDNSVFTFYETDFIFDFYQEHQLYYPKKNIKMPNFFKILKRLQYILSDDKSEYDAKLLRIRQIVEAILVNSNCNNNKYIAQRYLMMKLYQCRYNDVLDEVELKANQIFNERILPRGDYKDFNNLKVSIEKLKNSTRDQFISEIRKGIQKDKEILKIKGIEKSILNNFEIDLVAYAFLEVLKEEKYQMIFQKNHDYHVTGKSKIAVLEEFESKYTRQESVGNLVQFRFIAKEQNKLIFGFYAMALMLSKPQLSELYNNMVSFQQAYAKIVDIELNEVKLYQKSETSYIYVEDALLVLRILLYSDSDTSETKCKMLSEQDLYLRILEKFIRFDPTLLEDQIESDVPLTKAQKLAILEKYNKELSVREQLYIQKDGVSLVVFNQILNAEKEDILKRYHEYFEKNPILLNEIKKFNNLEKQIENINKNIGDLKETLKETQSRESQEDLLQYKLLQKNKFDYIGLKNRILFTNVSRMNHILIDIYGKLTGLIGVLEKDITGILIFEDKLEKVTKNTKIFDEFLEKSFFAKVYHYNEQDKKVRNNFAHFHYLRDDKDDNPNFLEQLNQLRHLLRLDRKLKNAVTKSVIKTFDKHGFELKFKMANIERKHKLIKYKLNRKELNDKYLITNEVYPDNDHMLEMIKAIIFKNCEEI